MSFTCNNNKKKKARQHTHKIYPISSAAPAFLVLVLLDKMGTALCVLFSVIPWWNSIKLGLKEKKIPPTYMMSFTKWCPWLKPLFCQWKEIVVLKGRLHSLHLQLDIKGIRPNCPCCSGSSSAIP